MAWNVRDMVQINLASTDELFFFLLKDKSERGIKLLNDLMENMQMFCVD
jgi:hypothetical protein